MHTAMAIRIGSSLLLMALGALGLDPGPEHPIDPVDGVSSSSGLDTGRREGGLRLLTHSPGIEERGIAHDSAEIRVRFDRELDPESVNPENVQLGWIDREGGFNPVPAELALADLGTAISLRPTEPLWPAIYYHMRLRGAAGGLSALHGPPLDADYQWRFATGVALDAPSEAARRLYSCSLPPTTDPVTGTGSVMVNVYQSVCNPALLPRKNTVVRAWAPWYVNGAVAVAEQLPFFDATVRFTSSAGDNLGQVEHRFYRPDTPNYKALADFGENTANLFTSFPAGTRHTAIKAEVEPTDGTTLRFSPGAASVTWRTWRTDRENLSYHVYQFDFLGSGPPITEPTGDIVRTAADLVLLTEQAFPLESADWSDGGTLTIGSAAAPSRTLNPVAGQEFPHWDLLTGDGTVRRAGQMAAQEIADLLAREAGSLVGSDTDVVIGIVPGSLLTAESGANALAATIPVSGGKVILTPATAPHMVLHEVGHRFGLLHCPFPGGSSYRFGNIRSAPCDVEGFRIKPDGTDGWNKSRTEGNSESQWLTALMFYTAGQRDEFTDVDRPGVHNTGIIDTWPSMDSYRSLMLEFATFTSPAPTPEPAPELPASPASGPSAASPNFEFPARAPERVFVPDHGMSGPGLRGSTVSVRGFANPDGSDAWITTVEIVTDGPATDLDGELETIPGLSVVARDRSGAVVGEQSIRVSMFEAIDSVWSAEDARHFQVVLAASDELGSVAITGEGGAVLVERVRSASPPVVRLLDPESGDDVDGGDQIRWEGSDPDGDPVSYEVQARTDGPWIRIGATLEQSMQLEGRRVPAGPEVDIRVIARDGFDRAEALVESVEVRRAPVPVILESDTGPGAAVEGSVAVAFDAPMNAGQLASVFQMEDPDGAPVPLAASLSEDGRQASLRPDEPLRPGSLYTVRVDAEFEDTHGNELADDYSWTFRTRPDEVAPLVRETLPAPGALTIDPGAPIRIAMTEPLDSLSVNGSTVQVEQGGVAVDGQVRWVPQLRSIFFLPAAPLDRNTRVRVSVDGVRDPVGNALATPHIFEFTTAGRLLPVRPRPGGGQ